MLLSGSKQDILYSPWKIWIEIWPDENYASCIPMPLICIMPINHTNRHYTPITNNTYKLFSSSNIIGKECEGLTSLLVWPSPGHLSGRSVIVCLMAL